MAPLDSHYKPNHSNIVNHFEYARRKLKDIKWELNRGEWYQHPLDSLSNCLFYAMEAWLEFKRMPRHGFFGGNGWSPVYHDFKINAPEMFKDISSIINKLTRINFRLFPCFEPDETPVIRTKKQIRNCYYQLYCCIAPIEAIINKLESDCSQEIIASKKQFERSKKSFFARSAGKGD